MQLIQASLPHICKGFVYVGYRGADAGQASSRPDLDAKVAPVTAIIFILLLATGLLFTVYGLYTDIHDSGVPVTTYIPFLLLGVALLIALAFEFVNGFHDTANAVATVIYTHSLPAQFAVVWSGLFNFLGVLWSSGAVAFAIVSLLPVELILQVGSAPASRWFSPCCSPRSSGTSGRGGSVCRPRRRTR